MQPGQTGYGIPLHVSLKDKHFRSLNLRIKVKTTLVLTCLFSAFAVCTPASSQKVDTLISWNDYSKVSTTHLTVFDNPSDEKRPSVVVLSELAENEGTPPIRDARFAAQRVGRQYNIDPAKAYWIFRWTASSFTSNSESDKEVLFQATFRWSKQKTLTGPSWRIIDRNRLLELTDRQWSTSVSR